MVTHAKDIVDRMKKRVITLEKGEVVRDQEGEYTIKPQIKEKTLFAGYYNKKREEDKDE